MKGFVKLVNFEIGRFAKLYGMLLFLIFLIQTITTVVISKVFMQGIISQLKTGGADFEQFKINLSMITYSLGFFAPVLMGVVAILFYIFFIWYRDWFARNAFVYRLLTLPTSRMMVFFAKLSTILLSVFGLVAFQLVALKIHHLLLKMIVPVTYRDDLTIFQVVLASEYLSILVPSKPMDFFIAYGLGTAFVIVIFTMILLERSFRFKGLLISIPYFGFCVLLLLLPVIIQAAIGRFYLYAGELFIVEVFMTMLLVGLSLWISRYLLNYKVTV